MTHLDVTPLELYREYREYLKLARQYEELGNRRWVWNEFGLGQNYDFDAGKRYEDFEKEHDVESRYAGFRYSVFDWLALKHDCMTHTVKEKVGIVLGRLCSQDASCPYKPILTTGFFVPMKNHPSGIKEDIIDAVERYPLISSRSLAKVIGRNRDSVMVCMWKLTTRGIIGVIHGGNIYGGREPDRYFAPVLDPVPESKPEPEVIRFIDSKFAYAPLSARRPIDVRKDGRVENMTYQEERTNPMEAYKIGDIIEPTAFRSNNDVQKVIGRVDQGLVVLISQDTPEQKLPAIGTKFKGMVERIYPTYLIVQLLDHSDATATPAVIEQAVKPKPKPVHAPLNITLEHRTLSKLGDGYGVYTLQGEEKVFAPHHLHKFRVTFEEEP